MRVVLGNYGNGNTGDEAVLAGLLLSEWSDRDVVIVSRNPTVVQQLHGVSAIEMRPIPFCRAVLQSRELVIGGGGLFGRGLPPLVRLLPWVAVFAALIGKRVRFVALGAYADTPWITRRMLQVSCLLAHEISARDEESRETLSAGLACRRTVRVVNDPAVELPAASAASVLEATGLDLCKSSPIVVSVKAMPDQRQLAHLLDELGTGLAARAAQLPVVFLCLSDQGDYGLGATAADSVLAQHIIDEHLSGVGVIVGPGLHPGVAKAIVAGGRAVLAMRLHAQIFAVSTGVPLLGISFEPKSRSWLRAQGRGPVETTDVTAASVAAWIDSVI